MTNDNDLPSITPPYFLLRKNQPPHLGGVSFDTLYFKEKPFATYFPAKG